MTRERALRQQTEVLVDAVSASRDFRAAPDASLTQAMRRLGEVRQTLDALGAELAAAIAERCDGENSLATRFAAKSPAALVAELAGIEADEAAVWCRAGAIAKPPTNLHGEQLPTRYPRVVEAIETGALTVRAAVTIVDTLETLSARVDLEELCEVERILLALAPELTRRQLNRFCQQVIDRADPDGVEPREDDLRARSGIRVRQRRDGLVEWIVTMHPEAAGFIMTAIDARTAPRRRPHFMTAEQLEQADDPVTRRDDRTLPQQRLDALQAIAKESLGRDDGEVGGTPVTMVVNISYEALVSGVGAASIEGVDTPISAATARRLACEAEIIPAVFGGPSERLDLGRAERLFSRAQRRAMALRDGGCTWPGCEAPPGWCEVAHLLAWYLGGATDLDNGILLCPFHHRRFDRDGWQFEWRDGVHYFVPPPWLDASRTPRRGGNPGLSPRTQVPAATARA